MCAGLQEGGDLTAPPPRCRFTGYSSSFHFAKSDFSDRLNGSVDISFGVVGGEAKTNHASGIPEPPDMVKC